MLQCFCSFGECFVLHKNTDLIRLLLALFGGIKAGNAGMNKKTEVNKGPFNFLKKLQGAVGPCVRLA